MRKSLSSLVCVLILVMGSTSIVFGQNSETTKVVKLAYVPIDRVMNGGIYTLHTKLETQNIGSASIYNVVVKVIDFDGANMDIDYFSLGDINTEESMTSENFVITFDTSIQEPPKILWEVEYTDVDGNRIIENILAK